MQTMSIEGKAQIAIRIDEGIVRQFKSCVALRGERISDVLTELIQAYIAETKTLESSGKL